MPSGNAANAAFVFAFDFTFVFVSLISLNVLSRSFAVALAVSVAVCAQWAKLTVTKLKRIEIVLKLIIFNK